MRQRTLGRTGYRVSPIGFGAFKIGRNQGVKYPEGYELPDDAAVERLLNAVLDAGISYIDTAPAYGISEERIGRFLARRRREFVLSTKVGETFADGKSSFDFSSAGIRASVQRSLQRLQTDAIDVLFVHSDGNDLAILSRSDVIGTLLDLKASGTVRAIGMSGKTVEGALESLKWADVLMVEYHLQDRSHEQAMATAVERGVGVVIKKGLAAGHLPADDALRFVLGNPHVGSMVVGGFNIDHIRANIAAVGQL
jgi:aryl-alcohol dehydrogenase-like predicted oxidoreductase